MLAAGLPHLIAFPLVGLIAGIAIGLTGMGGGVVLTPIMLLLGVPARTAIGNDLLVSLLIKPVGVLAHRGANGIRTDIVRRLAAGSVPAALVGAVVVNTVLRGRQASLGYLIGATLVVAAAMMVVRLLTPTRAGGATPSVVRTWPTVAVGALGGLLVGMTSVGSGSLMLVLLSWLYPRLSSRELVGTDLAQAIPLVAAAAVGHLLFGDVRASIVVPVLLGALPGVWVGSRWSVRMSDRALRPVLAVLVGATGLHLLGVL